MAGTPVERLDGVRLTDENSQPPPHGGFSGWERTSILRQLALEPPPPDTPMTG